MDEIIIIFILLLIILVGFKSILHVPLSYAYVIERLGKYHKTAPAGINIIIPLLDHVHKKIDLSEQTLKTAPQLVIAGDNKTLWYVADIRFHIVDPQKSTYEIVSIPTSLSYLTTTIVRDVMSKISSDNISNSLNDINSQLSSIISEAAQKWGIAIDYTELSIAKSTDNLEEPPQIENFNDFENSNFIQEFK
ncbi:MAG: hypothetical protein E7314_04590 [Clostridiales bacterium]|nr:hypothetical protein [Clostridiales bacterium]